GGEQHVPLAAGQLRLAGDNESAALLELHGAVVRRLAAQAQLVEVIGRGGPVELDQAEALDRAGHDEDDLAGARLELERPLWVNVEFGAGGLAVVVAVEDDGIALADGDLIGGFRHGPAAPGGGLAPHPATTAVGRHLSPTCGRRGMGTKNTKSHNKVSKAGPADGGQRRPILFVSCCVFCGHCCLPSCFPPHGVVGPSRKLTRESCSRSLTGRTVRPSNSITPKMWRIDIISLALGVGGALRL